MVQNSLNYDKIILNELKSTKLLKNQLIETLNKLVLYTTMLEVNFQDILCEEGEPLAGVIMLITAEVEAFQNKK